MRSTVSQRSAVSSKATTTPEPRLAPMARSALEGERSVELLGRHEGARGAAQEDRLRASSRRHPARPSSSARSVVPKATS